MHLVSRADPVSLPAYSTVPLPSSPNNEPNANDPNRGSAQHSSTNGSSVHSGGWIGIAIALFIVAIVFAFIAFFIYRHLRARRLGIPPPSLNPFADSNRIRGGGGGGAVRWVKDKFYTLRRGRNAGGAYEGSARGPGAGGAYGGFGGIGQRSSGRGSGFRGLDPDEAWDERVGTEADYVYEEQGVGLRDQTPRGLTDEDTGYERARYGPLSRQAPGDGDGVAEGRSELYERYDVETGQKARAEDLKDPFEDPQTVASLRSMSPPRSESLESTQGSRKSAFREGNMT